MRYYTFLPMINCPFTPFLCCSRNSTFSLYTIFKPAATNEFKMYCLQCRKRPCIASKEYCFPFSPQNNSVRIPAAELPDWATLPWYNTSIVKAIMPCSRKLAKIFGNPLTSPSNLIRRSRAISIIEDGDKLCKIQDVCYNDVFVHVSGFCPIYTQK